MHVYTDVTHSLRLAVHAGSKMELVLNTGQQLDFSSAAGSSTTRLKHEHYPILPLPD